MNVTRYAQEHREVWDAFVSTSRNGTFLIMRGYMDYHADRFADHSLLITSDDGQLLALLPANLSGDSLESHGGLTYGGLIVDSRMTVTLMLRVFEAVVSFARELGCRTIVYKTIPHIYHDNPAEEDGYALFRAGARLVRRDHLAVIDYRCPYPYQERRIRAIRKAEKRGLAVRECDRFDGFWRILEDNLVQRYNVRPVHAVEEIVMLKSRFPESIQLFGAYAAGDELRAGALLYVSRHVAHVQYNAASPAGKEEGALDVVLDALVSRFAGTTRWFDFGISTEQMGNFLNEGLADYKEGFGARTVVHDHYELDVASCGAERFENAR